MTVKTSQKQSATHDTASANDSTTCTYTYVLHFIMYAYKTAVNTAVSTFLKGQYHHDQQVMESECSF